MEADKIGHEKVWRVGRDRLWYPPKLAMGKRKSAGVVRSRGEKTGWVKDVLHEWASAMGKNDSDMLGLDEAPEWVLNALVECVKIVFPRGLSSAQKREAQFLGEFLGRLHGLERLYAGEVPLGSETEAEWVKIQGLTANGPAPKNLRALEKEFQSKFDATRKIIPLATAMAGNATYEEARDFQKGLQRGIEIKPDELATSRTFQRHTRTFWVLGLFWRHWVKCKSVREVYEQLCKMVGEQKIGSFKSFENHVAKKIGMKFRGRGRPKTAK